MEKETISEIKSSLMGNHGSSQVIYCSWNIKMELLRQHTQAERQMWVTAYCLMSNTDIGILEFAQEEWGEKISWGIKDDVS